MAYNTLSHFSNIQEFIEIIDSNDKPIMVINKEQANLKTILHRTVVVVMQNCKKQNLITYKKVKDTDDYILDLRATAVVRAGESRIDAALRTLSPEIKNIPLIEGRSKLPNSMGTNILDNLHITLFFAKIGNDAIYKEHIDFKDSIFLDRDELTGIASHSPSLLSYLLNWAISTNVLFEQNANSLTKY